MGDPTRGLYEKFLVVRTDGTSEPGKKHDGCQYFVLDVTHDAFADAALQAYANACRSATGRGHHDDADGTDAGCAPRQRRAMKGINEFSGLRIIESALLTEAGEPYEVRRTWTERLFSRPWQPLRARKTITPQVPMKGGYRIANGTIVMHPDTVRALRLAMSAARPAEDKEPT